MIRSTNYGLKLGMDNAAEFKGAKNKINLLNRKSQLKINFKKNIRIIYVVQC